MTFAIPLFKSGFRPFFLLGSIYGVLLMLSWLPGITGQADWSPRSTQFLLWHQHEMLFGFAAAIVCGFILTALPSWAKSKEIQHGKLAFLVTAWLLGRIAYSLSDSLPQAALYLFDLSFPIAFLAIAGPELLRVKNKFYLLLYPFLIALFLGNLLFHYGIAHNDLILAGKGIRIGIYTIIFHCSIVGGFLTPIFTETALVRSTGACQIPVRRLWDWLALLSIPLLALSDVLEFPPFGRGSIAFFAVFVHGMRMRSWRTLQILDNPVLWIMHLGYLWLLIAFILRGLEDFGLLPQTGAWVHAFTIGTLGSLMMGFMTRIVLRHTGRPLVPHPLMVVCYYLMLGAALIRVYIALIPSDNLAFILSALLWTSPFAVYLFLYGKLLLLPSLPRE